LDLQNKILKDDIEIYHRRFYEERDYRKDCRLVFMKRITPVNRLNRGKRFHKKIQDEWKKEAEGSVKSERFCVKPSGRKGRMDIHVEVGDKDRLVSCVEIKNTDWDLITEKRIRAYVNRQAGQVWDYIESELERRKDVSPGIIFPKKPKSKRKLILIEKMFDERGIPVVWMNESIEERKKR